MGIVRSLLSRAGYELAASAREVVRPRPKRGPAVFSCTGIDWNPASVDHLLEDVLPRYRAEWELFPDRSDDPLAYRVENPYFSLVDAGVMHALVRERRPPAVIEIGSGFSSRVLSSALLRNGSGRLVCVDPEPRAALEGLGAEVRRVGVETLPLSFFDSLGSGSVLSIDSSHRGGTGSDVTYLLLEVLPRLRPGVLVHVHDIYLPEDYPASWNVDQAWGYDEQYLLHALLTFTTAFTVVWPGRWVLRERLNDLRHLFPREDLLGLTCSFWLESR